MPKAFIRLCFLLGSLSVLVACATTTQPAQTSEAAEAVVLPTVTPEPTAVPTELPATPTELPTAVPTEPSTPAPTPTTSPTDWTTTATVDGDYYVLGNPQAPIRLIDFSDFF